MQPHRAEYNRQSLHNASAESSQTTTTPPDTDKREVSHSSDLWQLSQELWCLLDAYGNFADLNPAWQRQLGWSREDLLYRPWHTQIHPQDLAMTLAAYQTQPSKQSTKNDGSSESVINIEHRYRAQAGHYTWVRWSMLLKPEPQRYLVGHLIPPPSGQDDLQAVIRTDIAPLELGQHHIETFSETLDLPSFRDASDLSSNTESPSIQNPGLERREAIGRLDSSDLKTLLSSHADQLTDRYRNATSVSYLPNFPVSYAGLFESLLESLRPAIPYDVSGIMLLQESSAISAPNPSEEKSIHSFLNEMQSLDMALRKTLQAHLLKTFSFLAGCDFQGFPLYQHLNQGQIDHSSISKVELTSPDFTTAGEVIGSAFKSQLIVPLVINPDANKNAIIGVLFVAAQQDEKFTEEHIRLLYNAAGHLSISLQRLQLIWFKAEKQHLSQILDNLPTGVILLDSNQNIIFSNKISQDFLNHIGVDCQQDQLLSLGNHDLKDLLQAPVAKPYHLEVSALNSPDLIFEITIWLLTPNKNNGDWIISIRDISDQKNAENRIRQTLEKEKEINTIKSQIIRTVSHEYRSPLTSILASAQTLKQYSARLHRDKKMRLLDLIENSARNLNRMVSEMLALEEVESGHLQLNPQPIDIVKFSRSIIEEVKLLGNERHRIVLIHRGNTESVKIDPHLTCQILTNLLSNAIKYSPYGGEVKLSINCENTQVIFQIDDQGIGIPLDEQARIFQSFYRASNIGVIQGTGLGLNITKKFVDVHQGSISFRSQVDEGSTFFVKLPNFAQN